jgi:Siphovirus ReqiPepy6 Gp37-like protein
VPEWVVYVRAPDLTLAAQIDDYQKLDMVLRFNDLETWLLDVDATTAPAPSLMLDHAGLVVTCDGTVVFSGPVTRRERDFDGDHNRLRVSGFGDLAGLAGLLASPQPATSAPPYNSQGYDVRTGVCSTILRQYVNVNAGPGALGARQVPGLTLAADPALGTTITGRARWQPLLELLQDLAVAGGGLGFRVLQVGAGVQFGVYAVTDRTTSVIFTADLGNLEAFAWSEEAPAANYVFVGGGGEDVLRTIYESQDSASVARWGRIESFRDRRDTTVAAELAQAAIDELQQSAGPTSMAMTPIDLPQMAYPANYSLGDKVTAVMDGVAIQQVIREVHITLSPESGALVVPTIGTPGRQDLLGIFDRLRTAEARLVTLERR